MKEKKPLNKKDRFEKVAAYRVQKIIDMLQSLSNCANKNNYEYSEADVKKMFKVLRDKLRIAELNFDSKLKKEKSSTFKF